MSFVKRIPTYCLRFIKSKEFGIAMAFTFIFSALNSDYYDINRSIKDVYNIILKDRAFIMLIIPTLFVIYFIKNLRENNDIEIIRFKKYSRFFIEDVFHVLVCAFTLMISIYLVIFTMVFVMDKFGFIRMEDIAFNNIGLEEMGVLLKEIRPLTYFFMIQPILGLMCLTLILKLLFNNRLNTLNFILGILYLFVYLAGAIMPHFINETPFRLLWLAQPSYFMSAYYVFEVNGVKGIMLMLVFLVTLIGLMHYGTYQLRGRFFGR